MLERRPRALLKAVDGVTLSIARGETLGLVGESGCGKSTVARLIVGLHAPTRGTIEFDGAVLAGGAGSDSAGRRAARRGMQMIFQDPYASLNPRWRVADIVAEPIRAGAPGTATAEIDARVASLLAQVGLDATDGAKYPHQFSGGQRQRVSSPPRRAAASSRATRSRRIGCRRHPRRNGVRRAVRFGYNFRFLRQREPATVAGCFRAGNRRAARRRYRSSRSQVPLRLTQIKLAGFKSFVDPTAIGTPGQLVGIVGPNGCGKSNVIDAVRWVLGESKASALRGESMQDVIFNGAGERKPVGRASVELHFDNSAGRIGGQWGQYVDLSIKRVLTRDGDSTYYINNIPVRRRDIHDLFLGTGLGPRAYAIIEQGMISRVIEAKPEELRVFLEEAAGVSKYKERRKETEGRLVRRAREPRPRRRHPDRARQPAGEARRAGQGRHRIPRARDAAEARAAPALVLEAAGRRERARAARFRHRHAHRRARERAGGDPRGGGEAGGAARRPLRGRRRDAREAGGVLRGERRGDAPRAAARVRARERDADHPAGRAAHRADRRAHRAGRRARRRSRRAREGHRGRAVGAGEDGRRGAGGGGRAADGRAVGCAGGRGIGRRAAAGRARRTGDPRRRNEARESRTRAGAARRAARAARGRARGSRGPGERQDRRGRRAAPAGNGRARVARGGAERAARCRAGAAGSPARGERRRPAGGTHACGHRGARRGTGGAAGEDRPGQGQHALDRRQGPGFRPPAVAGPRHRAGMGRRTRSRVARTAQCGRARAPRDRPRLAGRRGGRTERPAARRRLRARAVVGADRRPGCRRRAVCAGEPRAPRHRAAPRRLAARRALSRRRRAPRSTTATASRSASPSSRRRATSSPRSR